MPSRLANKAMQPASAAAALAADGQRRWTDMRPLWCWRCQMVIPMLDEDEFSQVSTLLRDGLEDFKSGRLKGSRDVSFAAALQEYERITGFAETNGNALWHHRISLLGPDCDGCGHPLRTPVAQHCASCGRMRSNKA